MDRYNEAEKLLAAVVAAKDESAETLASHWDTLFDYVFEQFPAPKSAGFNPGDNVRDWKVPKEFFEEGELSQTLIYSQDVDTLTHDNLCKLSDWLYPVGIGKLLLVKHHISIHPKLLTTFAEFARRCKYLMWHARWTPHYRAYIHVVNG
tara:strand:+ start:1669 stop:2115 length:447 start_codon:yes stop_codon:yes gene_type:complete